MGSLKITHARLLALALATLCLLLLKAGVPDLLTGIDNRASEAAWRMSSTGEERRVVIVDIDESSLARVGPWPWSRERMATLLGKLTELEAGPVVFDIVFPDPQAGDVRFAAELARHPSVLAQIFSLRPGTPAAAGQLQGALAAPACNALTSDADGFIANSATLISATGHITPRIDRDGAVRHLPALVCHEGKAYPALGIAALMRAANAEPSLQLSAGKDWLDPAWQLTHPAFEGIAIPLAENGDIRLSYRLPRSAFISIPASDVLEGRAPAHLLRGAIVLVGATAFGLGDAVPTPHGGAVGGVEVHAQFISALLDNRLPYQPRAASPILLALALSGILLLLAISIAARNTSPASPNQPARRFQLPVWGLPILAIVLAGILLAVHIGLLLGHNLWIGWAEPATLVLFSGLFLAAVEHAQTRFERERLFGNLSAYLPASVARKIAFKEVSGAIQAERREISVLFADIRNFSAYCEGRPPEETAALLHAFFTTAAQIVEDHHGVIEEYVGDAIMAVWNGDSHDPEHPAHAFAAAQRIIDECNQLFPDPPPPGLEPLAIGVGLECGEALVGSFGPIARRIHTALGETVTIAARLTAMTGDLAHPLLIGEKAASRLTHTRLMSLGEFLLEGLRRPRKIHAPLIAPVITLVHPASAKESRGA